MSDYAMQAEAEMWDAIAAQPAPAEELAWRDGSQGRRCLSNAEQLAAASWVPSRCGRCDRMKGREELGALCDRCRCWCPDDCRCRRETNAPCGCKRH